MKKWIHDLNMEFSKEEVQMANKYMMCSTSLVTKEMPTKTTLKFHLTSVKMAIFKGKNNNNKCWQGCRERGTLIHCWWECKLAQPLWKAVWRCFKKLKIELDTAPGHLPKGT
jgi:hypothetical protein